MILNYISHHGDHYHALLRLVVANPPKAVVNLLCEVNLKNSLGIKLSDKRREPRCAFIRVFARKNRLGAEQLTYLRLLRYVTFTHL